MGRSIACVGVCDDARIGDDGSMGGVCGANACDGCFAVFTAVDCTFNVFVTVGWVGFVVELNI